MSATERAVAICKAQFERHLAEVGTVAEWRQRSGMTPGNASAISAAAGRPDPAEGGGDVKLHLVQQADVPAIGGDRLRHIQRAAERVDGLADVPRPQHVGGLPD